MDLEVKIKEEPAWLEETTNASLENIEHISEVIALKEEVKSELTDPGSAQEKSLEPPEDIKEEIFIEEHTDDQLLQYIKEETKSSPEVSNTDHQPPDGGEPCFRCSACGKILAGKLSLLRHLKSHRNDRSFKCDHCGKLFGRRNSLSNHLRFHADGGPYLCNVCGMSFTRKDSLAYHMRTHTDLSSSEDSKMEVTEITPRKVTEPGTTIKHKNLSGAQRKKRTKGRKMREET
ncbi:zinc finger protein 134-like [Anabrus simplex]|uniref:zinc finger protein 134-like n=1 Tax=Anabrus simplex TaxID=316456 RepID=UPI0035A31B11